MTALVLTADGPLTMSSREIAELTGKEHKNVLADIRKMLDGLGLTSADFSADLPDAYGRPQQVFNLPKRECLILVSGYSVELRARIIDRWMDLEEAARRPALPDFTSPVAAARAWADEVEAKQIAVAALEAAKPKLDAYDHFLGSRAEGMNLQRAMKAINVGPNRGIAALRAGGVLFGTPAMPRQYHCEQGYFEVRPVEGTDGKVRPQTLVTPKGLDWLRSRLSGLVGR